MVNRFNFRKWTFDGKKLNNPLVMLWRLIMVPIYTLALLLFCLVSFLSDFDFEGAKEIFNHHSPQL